MGPQTTVHSPRLMELNLKPYFLVDTAKRVAIPLANICVSFSFIRRGGALENSPQMRFTVHSSWTTNNCVQYMKKVLKFGF